MKGKNVILERLPRMGMELHALSVYPKECCGLLFGRRDTGGKVWISEALPLENRAAPAESGRRFVADPMAVWKLEEAGRKKGLEVIGIYHSHPDEEAVLSDEDEREMIPGQIYAVLSVSVSACTRLRMWEKKDCGGNVSEVEAERL